MADCSLPEKPAKGKQRHMEPRPSRKIKKKRSKSKKKQAERTTVENMPDMYDRRFDMNYQQNGWNQIAPSNFSNFPTHSALPTPEYYNDSVNGDFFEAMNRLQEQCHALSVENESLKSAIFNVRNLLPNSSGPEIDVTFKSDDLSRHFKSEVERFLADLLSRPLPANEGLGESNNEAELFVMNSEASHPDPYNDRLPIYHTNKNDVLGDNVTKKTFRSSFGPRCFNCGEGHILSNCPEALDYDRIAQRRTERLMNTPQSNRYHLQEQNMQEQVFDSFKPGVISKELRLALQLDNNQIPPYIYRMRLLGYPPGWLEEASVKSSGLVLYGKDENDKDEKSKKPNSGEANYDVKKLVDFPGFNVPLCPDFIDESTQLGYPPFQTSQLRSSMENTLKQSESVTTSRKRKLGTSPSSRPAKQRCLEDMDIEESEDESLTLVDECAESPPLPPEDSCSAPPLPPPTPPLPPLPPDESSYPSEDGAKCLETPAKSDVFDERPDSRDSLSLTELEEQKKMLMLELSGSISDNEELSETEESSAADATNVSAQGSQEMVDATSDHSSGLHYEMTLGSPSLPSFNSFSKLPDHAKFKEGIQGQLFSETLPASRGAFDRVKDLLKLYRENHVSKN